MRSERLYRLVRASARRTDRVSPEKVRGTVWVLDEPPLDRTIKRLLVDFRDCRRVFGVVIDVDGGYCWPAVRAVDPEAIEIEACWRYMLATRRVVLGIGPPSFGALPDPREVRRWREVLTPRLVWELAGKVANGRSVAVLAREYGVPREELWRRVRPYTARFAAAAVGIVAVCLFGFPAAAWMPPRPCKVECFAPIEAPSGAALRVEPGRTSVVYYIAPPERQGVYRTTNSERCAEKAGRYKNPATGQRYSACELRFTDTTGVERAVDARGCLVYYEGEPGAEECE